MYVMPIKKGKTKIRRNVLKKNLNLSDNSDSSSSDSSSDTNKLSETSSFSKFFVQDDNKDKECDKKNMQSVMPTCVDRYFSFENCSLIGSKYTAKDYAYAGFAYDGDESVIKCNFCGHKLMFIDDKLSLLELHHKVSPRCEFVMQTYLPKKLIDSNNQLQDELTNFFHTLNESMNNSKCTC